MTEDKKYWYNKHKNKTIMSSEEEKIENELVEENFTTEENQEEPQAENKENSLEEKYNILNDSYLRLMAEYDNYRKRTLKEKAELIRNGGESVILAVLSVVDNFERAIQSMEAATDVVAVKDGIELIYQQLMTNLKQQGLKQIETDNQDFDTEFHEAITTIPAPDESRKGKIIDTTQKGYILNNKVIRHAKVVVGE
ncbi:MAG: nucleotide exchange factor GrpE [Prevotellaceae bacterium]|jgi:molecular chaperone GrpE|nr:nucleotide exchange factor GrpE [Prevotellaceae bacterium]